MFGIRKNLILVLTKGDMYNIKLKKLPDMCPIASLRKIKTNPTFYQKNL
jgi:hypothetical protein